MMTQEPMQIDEIRKLIRAGRYEVSLHAQQERLEDDLDMAVHVVLGWAQTHGKEERTLRMITVYIPKAPKWRDPRTRGEKP